MHRVTSRVSAIIRMVICGTMLASPALSAPSHGISMYGEPALPPDFVSFPYANPEAPKGGRIVFGEAGGFDSVNPYIAAGRSPWQFSVMMAESLMARNWDEPFGLYGLLAETIEIAPDRSWVEFSLRSEARFSDGSPVTIDDVMWSYETLGTMGHPRYLGAWQAVEAMEQTGENSLRFTFSENNPELALIIGMRPILKRSQWENIDFTTATNIIPVTSAPYILRDFEPGRYWEMERNPNYWAEELPARRGMNNFDSIRLEYFGDAAVAFQAFKSGVLDSYRESNANRWVTEYDFAAVSNGDVLLAEIPHQRPSGMTGLVMNTRRAPFDDWRVRDAMLHAFNFEFINEVVTGASQPRITSYFSNSILGMEEGAASGKTLEYLQAFRDSLLPGALEGYALPVSDGSERNRAGIRFALSRLEEAGYAPVEGRMVDANGDPLTFEIVLETGDGEIIGITEIFVKSLQRLGITPQVTVVDDAQYREKVEEQFNFDMTYHRRGLSLSPGTEQRRYWGSDEALKPRGSNIAGIQSEAVDAFIEALITAENYEEHIAAVRALDRALMAGRYVLPLYQWNISRLAYKKEFAYPENLPIYGDWITWQPDVWWQAEEKD